MEQNPNQRSSTRRSGWRENTRLVLATALLSGSAFAADDARILELEKRINELENQNKTQEATISTLQDDAEQQRDGMQQLFNLTKDINQGIRVSGFLSAAVAQVAIDEELQWGNEGPDNEIDWNSDSIVGLQISYSITERLSAVLQMVSKGGFNSEFDADWFYLHYNFNESFSIMAGRIRPQFFMMSDYVEVGFTYPWIRPPVEVYDPIPTDVGQGVSFNYVTHWDDWEFRAHLQALQSEDQGTVSRFDAQILVAAFELSYNDWTLGLRKSNMQVDVLLQNEVLRRGSSILEQTASSLSILPAENADIEGCNLSLRYDDGALLILGEMSYFDLEGLFVDTDSFYLTTGYRFGQWLPHITYARLNSTDDDIRRDSRIETIKNNLPAGSADQMAVATVQSLAPILWNQESTSYAIGVNYFFSPQVVGKLEAKMVTDRNGTISQFQNANTSGASAPVIPDDDHIMIYGLSVDVVF